MDPRVAALGVIGLCNWVAWWHRPGGQRADQGVAEALADMAVASVAQRDGRVTEAGGAARVLALLKEDVALLERFLGDRGRPRARGGGRPAPHRHALGSLRLAAGGAPRGRSMGRSEPAQYCEGWLTVACDSRAGMQPALRKGWMWIQGQGLRGGH